MVKRLKVKFVLCDIEGTTTSINFVKNDLFPYAQREMKNFLEANWSKDDIKATVSDLMKKSKELLRDENSTPCTDVQNAENLEATVKTINTLIDKDFKIQELKLLQGLIWQKGYQENQLKGHVYSDVPDAFKKWIDLGIKIYIYSSGSEQAQKLLYANTEYGDLLQYISGHFDTRIGSKIEQQSYAKIIEKLNCNKEDAVFFTDIEGEAVAAKAAGLNVVVLNRPGNSSFCRETKDFEVIESFIDIELYL